MRVLRQLVLLSVAAITPLGAVAKRVEPLPVQPVELNGVRYEAPHACVLVKPQPLTPNGDCPNGGIVQAVEVRSGRVLWTVRIYATEYDNFLEQDVQEVYITTLRIKRGLLVIEDEKGRSFEADLRTREVRRVGAI